MWPWEEVWAEYQAIKDRSKIREWWAGQKPQGAPGAQVAQEPVIVKVSAEEFFNAYGTSG